MTEPGISAAKLVPLAAKAAASSRLSLKPLSCAVGAHFATYGELRCPRTKTKTPPAPHIWAAACCFPTLLSGSRVCLFSHCSCCFLALCSMYSFFYPPFFVLFAFPLPILNVSIPRMLYTNAQIGIPAAFVPFASFLLYFVFCFCLSYPFLSPPTPTSRSLQPSHTGPQYFVPLTPAVLSRCGRRPP